MNNVLNATETTLIILPGWGGSHETWADFVALAKPHFQEVVVIDLPCFGDEPCPTEVWGVEEYSLFVKEKIVAYSDRSIALLGHSFGGAVATYLVTTHPDIVDTLILSGPAIYRPHRYIRRTLFGIVAKFGTLLVVLIRGKRLRTRIKKLLYRIAGSPDYSETSGMKRRIFKKIIREDLRHLLEDITVPTCVIQGTDDAYVPYRYGENIARSIPFASFVSVKKGTHGLHQRRTAEFLESIMTFVNNR